jgi:hypothetical protein
MTGWTAMMAALALGGCVSVSEREFKGDYQPIWSVGVASEPGVSHRVYDLPKQNRLMVSRSFATQFNASFSTLSLLGVSDAKPGVDEMRRAAERFLAENRGACQIVDAAKSASSNDYEFRYACAGPAPK